MAIGAPGRPRGSDDTRARQRREALMTGSATAETMVTLSQPGRVIDVLTRCIEGRAEPGRSGWSAAGHLALDLERHFGVRATAASIDHALRVLQRRRAVRLRVDDDGRVWYRRAT
jgi:hypothetical protein